MSSFIKLKKESTPEIPGVKMSMKNCQVFSTGSDSFDFVLGGGIELKSVFLLGEDKFGRYSDILLKLFLADAFHHKHNIYLASLDENPTKIMKDIPMPNENQKEVQQQTDTPKNDLRIAFRYADLPKIDSTQRSYHSGVTYDLNRKYDNSVIKSYKNFKYFSFESIQEKSSPFDCVLKDLNELIKENPNDFLRICINSIGSPLWYTDKFSNELLRFLVQLKSITRYSNAVCFMTMPLHLINQIDDSLSFRIRSLVDCNINLESFNNIEKQTNAVFKQYNGLLHIKKLQSIAAFQSHKPDAFDLAFKLKSHRFIIEKLHLPPELQENEISMSCSVSGGNKSLDF